MINVLKPERKLWTYLDCVNVFDMFIERVPDEFTQDRDWKFMAVFQKLFVVSCLKM